MKKRSSMKSIHFHPIPLNGVFHFVESYWSHYGVFNHFQLEKNQFSVVLMQFRYQIMVTLWSF